MPHDLNDVTHALNAQSLRELPARSGCPVWAYDPQTIVNRIAQLRPFDTTRSAPKARSTTPIFRLSRAQGV